MAEFNKEEIDYEDQLGSLTVEYLKKLSQVA